jgi:predicted Zn-dependent protease
MRLTSISSDPGTAMSALPSVSSQPARGGYQRSCRRAAFFLACSCLLLLGTIAVYRGYYFIRAKYTLHSAEKACQQRDFLEARRLAQASLNALPEQSRALFLLARIARQAGFFDEAENRLDACRHLGGSTQQISLERALIQVQQGGLSLGTEAQLRQYLKEGHPESDQILEALCRGCLAAHRHNSALGYLNEWLDRSPNNIQARLWRSTVHERLVNFASAAEDCREILASSPESKEAQLRLAQVSYLAGQPHEATELFEALHRQDPGQPLVSIGLARCWIQLGQWKEAEQLLDELVANYPADAPVLLERGRLAMQKGQAALAEQWLWQAVASAPADYQTNYSLFLCLKQQGKVVQAQQVGEKLGVLEANGARFRELTETLRQNPYDLSPRCEIARLFFGQGQDNEGVHWLQVALKIDPTDRVANRLLADYYERARRPALARMHRQQADSTEVVTPLSASEP